MDAILQIVVIRADKRIAEIPHILGEDVICHIKTESPKLLDEEYRRGSRVALTENMDLPEP